MKTKLLILRILALVAALFFCLSCEKDNQLVGTTWQTEFDNSKLFFKDNSSGTYYWLEEGEYDPYKFSYSLKGNDIVVNVVFPRRMYTLTGVIEGDVIHMESFFDYVKL